MKIHIYNYSFFFLKHKGMLDSSGGLPLSMLLVKPGLEYFIINQFNNFILLWKEICSMYYMLQTVFQLYVVSATKYSLCGNLQTEIDWDQSNPRISWDTSGRMYALVCGLVNSGLVFPAKARLTSTWAQV